MSKSFVKCCITVCSSVSRYNHSLHFFPCDVMFDIEFLVCLPEITFLGEK